MFWSNCHGGVYYTGDVYIIEVGRGSLRGGLKTTNKQSQTNDRNRQIQSNYEGYIISIVLFVDAM